MSIPLTEIERINALLPTELFAGSKDWRVGSTADRVDWLLTMYSSAKEEVERLQSALEAQPQQELDCVLVPRDLIGAACSAIDRKRDAPKTLEQLRRYTVGDLSTNQPAQQEPAAWANPNDLQNFDMKVRTNAGPLHTVPLYTKDQI